MQRYFIASLLRHWNELVCALRQEPNGKWLGEKVNNHPFICKVQIAMQRVGGNMSTLHKWVEEITAGFVTKNYLALPIHMCINKPGVVIDTRGFIEIANGMSTQ